MLTAAGAIKNYKALASYINTRELPTPSRRRS